MNIFNYVTEAKALNNNAALAGIIILIVFFASIIIRMLTGMGRGIFRQLVRTALTLGSAILSFTLAGAISNGVLSSIDQSTVDGVINYLNSVAPELGASVQDLFGAFPPETLAEILMLPAAVVLIPIIFVSLFVLINLIINVVLVFLGKLFKAKKDKSNFQRFGGAILAAVEGIICFVVLLSPFSGAIGIINESYESAIVDEGGDINTEALTTYNEIILPITDNPLICFLNRLGSNDISSSFATVDIDGVTTDLRKDVVPFVKFSLVDAKGSNIDFKNLTEENKETITELLTALEDSPYLSKVVTGIVKGGLTLIESGKFIQLGNTGSGFTDALFDFLGGFSTNSFRQDLDTIKDVYFVLSDSGVLSALGDEGSDLMKVLGQHKDDGSSAVSDIINILQANPRTASLIKAMTDMLLANLSGGEVDGEPTVDYNELKGEVEKVLDVKEENYATEEEYKEAIGSVLNDTLKDHNINLEPEIIDGIADYVADNFSEVDSLTDAEFNEILLHYYEVYQDYITSGTVPDDFQDIIK